MDREFSRIKTNDNERSRRKQIKIFPTGIELDTSVFSYVEIMTLYFS
ncbi:hypothetical protein CMALT394_390003 [Carnobacterium maltaromaticum]|nr:hypothetical protein CMALT394_390003 [Carnobacterium maltaromaticum]